MDTQRTAAYPYVACLERVHYFAVVETVLAECLWMILSYFSGIVWMTHQTSCELCLNMWYFFLEQSGVFLHFCVSVKTCMCIFCLSLLPPNLWPVLNDQCVAVSRMSWSCRWLAAAVLLNSLWPICIETLVTIKWGWQDRDPHQPRTLLQTLAILLKSNTSCR